MDEDQELFQEASQWCRASLPWRGRRALERQAKVAKPAYSLDKFGNLSNFRDNLSQNVVSRWSGRPCRSIFCYCWQPCHRRGRMRRPSKATPDKFKKVTRMCRAGRSPK